MHSRAAHEKGDKNPKGPKVWHAKAAEGELWHPQSQNANYSRRDKRGLDHLQRLLSLLIVRSKYPN